MRKRTTKIAVGKKTIRKTVKRTSTILVRKKTMVKRRVSVIRQIEIDPETPVGVMEVSDKEERSGELIGRFVSKASFRRN